MMRIVNRTLAAAAMTALFVGGVSGAPAPEPAAQRTGAIPAAEVTRAGWWIRVNPANVAGNVSWRFGTSPTRLSNPLRWWRDETQNEFDVPEAQRALPTLHIAGLGLPYKETVSFCVFFQDHGAALLEFAGEKVVMVEQSQQEPACMP
jgi:hypothetical protein